MGCSQDSSLRKPLHVTSAPASAEEAQLLVLPEESDRANLISSAQELGLRVQGDTVLTIRGSGQAIAQLSIPEASGTQAVLDQVAFINAEQTETQVRSPAPLADASENNLNTLYMGASAFGIPEYLKENPTHDGRGVIVGILDDGISPHQSGLTVTSTGKRKILAMGETTRLYRIPLQLAPIVGLRFSQQLAQASQTYKGLIASDLIPQVRKPAPGSDIPTDFDLNLDGKDSQIEIEVGRVGDGYLVCVDRNADATAQADECQGTFEATGDFRFWDTKQRYALTVEVDPKSAAWVHLSSGERLGDSHGEGVASVLSAYKMSGTFNGVAPGSQLASYETLYTAYRPEDLSITLGQFLEAIDWLGSKGVKVINFSAFTYLSSSGTQAFLVQALRKLNQKYNFVFTIAAGNDGPGLNSNYERSAYAENALLVGAYLDPVQDEAVYGNSRRTSSKGLPIWFSSIGPGFDGGQSIDCVSPLASLSLQDPDSGVGSFGGTSSAAPHLAGFAAVLASAISAQNLPWDSVTAAHAIRQSGKPIEGVPYVQQGRGVPQIRAALQIYKELLSLKRPVLVRPELQSVKGLNGVPQKTPVISVSGLKEDQEFSLALKGLWSSAVSVKENMPALAVVAEYSHSWLTGNSRTWVAQDELAGSRKPFLRFSVNREELLRELQKSAQSEIFAEIRLKDESGFLVETIPVTVINDVSIENGLQTKVSLPVQSSERIHLRAAAPGILHVRTTVNESQRQFLDIRIYDGKSSVFRSFSRDASRSFTVQVREAGWIQIGLSRTGGSSLPMNVGVQAQMIRFMDIEKAIPEGAPLALRMSSAEPLDLQIGVFVAPQILLEDVVKVPDTGIVQWSTPVTAAGAYRVAFSPLQLPEYSYPQQGASLFLREQGGKLTRLVRFANAPTLSSAAPIPVSSKDVTQPAQTADINFRVYETGGGFSTPLYLRRQVTFSKEADSEPMETQVFPSASGALSVPIGSSASKGTLLIRGRVLPNLEWFDIGTAVVVK